MDGKSFMKACRNITAHDFIEPYEMRYNKRNGTVEYRFRVKDRTEEFTNGMSMGLSLGMDIPVVKTQDDVVNIAYRGEGKEMAELCREVKTYSDSAIRIVDDANRIVLLFK